ncbi:MAG: 50S ribosomal protein L18 [Candidatus Anoxychlamydiales bacterium]|uniref:50S ribosomal protein L18 n=1 Tax=marine sediment metagenome TaxID=412755 RepID=A0A0F9M1U1_9ZZZZ|nr:50S ribosomal protein L18 [Candidatus Anoxychlamydiales bacterium]NGX40907.1 50S ribosomal protein L18 [Candidatus Anoxychlamydiales bacterium]HEU64633.1 50S ribosomal protein L18 [Chlamydiota bacterium]
MHGKLKKRKTARNRRVLRVRKKLKGTKIKPRMSVNKTNKHLFVQLIDDENSQTIGAIGSYAKEFKGEKKSALAEKLGAKIAEIAKAKKVKEIIFDRGRYKYHGLLAILAKSARKAGLKF